MDAGVGAASSRRPKVSASPNTEAVSARVSGVCWWKMPCSRGERRVDAVAELVREREHVAAAAGVVEQHVRVDRRHGVRAEGAAALARAGAARRSSPRRRSVRRASPGGARRSCRRPSPCRSPPASRRGRPRSRRAPSGRSRRACRCRAARPSACTSGGRGRSGCGRRRSGPRRTRRWPRWRGCGGEPVRVVAQAVVDRLVGEQRVEDEGPRPQPGLEGPGDGLGRLAPQLSRAGEASRLRAMSSVTGLRRARPRATRSAPRTGAPRRCVRSAPSR